MTLQLFAELRLPDEKKQDIVLIGKPYLPFTTLIFFWRFFKLCPVFLAIAGGSEKLLYIPVDYDVYATKGYAYHRTVRSLIVKILRLLRGTHNGLWLG